jgi:hypothetical protein
MANEKIALTTPVTQPSIADYAPGSLYLQLLPDPRIVATLVRTDGRGEIFIYPAAGTVTDTPAAVIALIEALNSANLTTRTLWRRLFDKLVTDFPSRFTGGATVV